MTDIQALKNNIPNSPAFVLDETEIHKALAVATTIRENSDCKVLYSIKTLPLLAALEVIKPLVDGFSVSSLFEARLAQEMLAGQGHIHLTTPGIKLDEITELTSICSHISCNSLNQYQQVSGAVQNQASIGLRINPKLSFVDDVRYDPCRKSSKLGANLDDLLNSDIVEKIKGLHFHTVYSATTYAPLVQTVDKLRQVLGQCLTKLDWLNLGGGYLFDQFKENKGFIETVAKLKNDFDLEVYIEPGNTVVSKAGCLLATVLDCFNSDGKMIAILDTSVNHHPQLFEYQREPELHEHDPGGLYPVILAGSTCLAGDLFGEYCLNRRLQVGDRLVFKQVGAYSLVKANRFNGYNLPDIYLANGNRIKRIKHYSYEDYRQQWVSDA